ncbi:copper resistance CopC family protein [Geodermatophilus ruber]|uniref:CopC domain-containing protein n=1 Tax=Geodermatophilus ruber TaxID=504800 RepID=A0A1I4L7T4_9ACTN|nr:copper resistance CopC family protein [Geodermatophilus ruber]SFL86926.1 hypothetical protein SAMN04488085_12060 [Geodermatophilus ruber]
MNAAPISTRPSPLRGLLTVLVLAIGLVLGTATAVQAHTGLGSSNPVDGSTLTTPLPAVDLTFTGQVLLREVTVTGPAGASAASGTATTAGAVVSQPVTLTDAGRYTVAYAVTSGDGHPVEGSVSFTYAPPPPATPTSEAAAPTSSAPAAPTEAAAQRPAEEPAGLPGWVLAAAAVLVTGAVLLTARRLRSRR